MSQQLNTSAPLHPEHQWLNSALGRYLQQEEQVLYDQAVVDLFGFNALQIGCLQMDLLRSSRIANRYKSTEYMNAAEFPHLYCCDDFLPVADASLDLLILPHRLEFSERPHQTLREAERVMMPEGHLLISGFNPLSLWGMALFLRNLLHNNDAAAKTFPWNASFIGLGRLKDWLALLGFEVISVQMCCHTPPCEQESWHRRFSFMDKLGAKWLSAIGGVYFIVAKKRVVGMTPLKPSWKTAPVKPNLVVRPTQRKPSQRGHVE
ncbi:SAM-dependent methyltransferase [Methylotenera oryzisoli]|uniref:SAM-dependent methyltransferase n=1 Tax=Methylotenera oryzisoli TaxID=2080758 RepID=A0A4Y9VU36_9PROT|nr:methyltransferase domain-containing protein [Methylotenera oryzisoli]TFW73152.1 SAM-dependent methyltransferase [Methylotenera oryzisoli]